MRYELTDNEWSAIKPMLPNKPRGVPRVNDRRVLNGLAHIESHPGSNVIHGAGHTQNPRKQPARAVWEYVVSAPHRSRMSHGRSDFAHRGSNWPFFVLAFAVVPPNILGSADRRVALSRTARETTVTSAWGGG
jgi:hypothetical protein